MARKQISMRYLAVQQFLGGTHKTCTNAQAYILSGGFGLKIGEMVWFWSNSTVFSYYKANTSLRFSTFVAKRLGVSHDYTISSQWRHIQHRRPCIHWGVE